MNLTLEQMKLRFGRSDTEIEKNLMLQPKFTVLTPVEMLGGLPRLVSAHSGDVRVRFWTDVKGQKLTLPWEGATLVYNEHLNCSEATIEWPVGSIYPVSGYAKPKMSTLVQQTVWNVLMTLFFAVYEYKETKRPNTTLLLEFYAYYKLARIRHCANLIASTGRLVYSNGMIETNSSIGFALDWNEATPYYRLYVYINPKSKLQTLKKCPDFVG